MEPTQSQDSPIDSTTNISHPETPVPSLKRPLWARIITWVAYPILIFVTVAVVVSFPRQIERQRTEPVVAKIHATKLTMDDVTGVNLPPDPGSAADDTVAGIDANTNGIRDDVELAIFRDYATSSKTRAVLLQYALIKQMQVTLPVLNEQTVTASVEDNESRAYVCVWSLFADSRTALDAFIEKTKDNPDFETERKKQWREHFEKVDLMESYIDSLIVNTAERKNYFDVFYQLLRSYSSSNEGCDIEFSALPD
jgi:hypothetical protein